MAQTSGGADSRYERWAAEGPIVCASPVDRLRVGDWLVRCPKRYRKYGLASELTGAANGTLRAWRWVAANVAPEGRRPGLSFRHHYVVASLAQPDQQRYLAAAAADGISAEDLEALVHAERMR